MALSLLGTMLLTTEAKQDTIHYGRMGLVSSICAGLAVGTAEMLPIIIGGSVMFGSVLGLLMLGETLMLQGWSGVVILMTGIAMVATDPGEKVQVH